MPESASCVHAALDELRKLAAAKLAYEQPGQTLDATALVHEAYLRLVDADKIQHWNSRGHFFAAAAEAMRRILVEIARGKARIKRGGHLDRSIPPTVELGDNGPNYDVSPDGRQFIMAFPPADTTSGTTMPLQIDVVLNWFTELQQRVPTR